MNIEDVKKMSDEEIRVKVAKLCPRDEWVIIKRGLYYRENAHGYTSSISEAWKLPEAEARKHEMYAGRADVPGCEKVLIARTPIPNYPADLDAIASAEKLVPYEKQPVLIHKLKHQVMRYEEGVSDWDCYTATARQRAEAFILTMQ